MSLFAGIWMGFTLMNGFNPLTGATAGIDGLINVFTDAGDARVVVFTILVGSLIATIEHSGGVRGFVHFLETRRWVHNGVRAQILAEFPENARITVADDARKCFVVRCRRTLLV